MGKSLFKTSGSRISSFSTVVGITLVLTMVGALFIFVLVANAVTHHFKQQITVQVFLKETSSEQEILQFKKQLEGLDHTSAVLYTSREEAAQSYKEEIGEDFVNFLGYNPLLSSLDIAVKPGFSSNENMESMVRELEHNDLVQEVVYQKGLLQNVNENMGKWALGLIIIGVLFLIIAVVLIVNTIELAIFSQRFLIKSMQLVGATHWFIQKPFLKRGLWFGFVSSVFALAIIFGLLFYFRVDLTDVIEILKQNNRLLILIGGVVVVGLLISWLATAFAVRRFVRLEQSKLY